MEDSLIRAFTDTSRTVEQRVASARFLGALEQSHASYRVWTCLCRAFQNPDEPADVRIAAVQALAHHNPAAAPNQLVRHVAGDDDRRIRRAAVAELTRLARFPDTDEPMLQHDLAELQTSMAPHQLVNLAMAYGRDPRVLTLLHQAVKHADPVIRETAVGRLGSLGEMVAVVGTLHDESPKVRAAAAATLGYYSLLTPNEVAALEQALNDADASVQRAARTALRRLGLHPTPQPGSRRARGAPAQPSPQFDWVPLLEQWSREWLSDREYLVEMPDEVIEMSWLGYAGASEEEIAALEQRLGRTLPPSYRAFLAVSNGWRRTSPFIEQVYSTAEVDYFRVRNQEWIDIWLEEVPEVSEEQHRRSGGEQNSITFRAEYLPECVQISEVGDSAVYLLNPVIVTSEGEWEAWFMASWMPGARRYPSFWELMQAEHASFVRLEDPHP